MRNPQRCGRTGEVVEPMLTDQWFVAVTKPSADGKSIADKAIAAVETGAVKFHPEQWVNTYNHWMGTTRKTLEVKALSSRNDGSEASDVNPLLTT